MHTLTFLRNTLLYFFLFVCFSLLTGKSFAQRDPSLISSRNYVGIEAGANYTWLPGSANYYFGFNWPFPDDPAAPVVQPLFLNNPGSGIGFQIGGTLDFSFSDLLGLSLKLQYRQHSTSSTEDATVNTFDANGTNPGTADLEKTLTTRLGFLGIDAAFRVQLIKESLYGLVGFGYSSLLSDAAGVHEKILSSTNSSEFLFLPSNTRSGVTEFDIPSGKTNSYFNSSQIAAKLGIGTFIPLGSNGWVLTPEFELAIPLSEWESKTFQTEYSANGVTPPKMWYATLSIALKFPFGATSKEEMGSSAPVAEKTTPEVEEKGYAHLTGKVSDRKTGKPIHANLTVTDLNDNQVVANTHTNADGEYNVRVKAPGKYSVTADADGYLFGSALYDVDPEGRILRGNHDITLDEASGRTRLLVFFDFNKAELQRSSYPELERIVRLMQANPNMEVEIAGYSDAVGTDSYNLDLSHRRADAVREFLLQKGVSNLKVTSKGYGKANPIASNDTEEGRADNRRVEFVVLHK